MALNFFCWRGQGGGGGWWGSVNGVMDADFRWRWRWSSYEKASKRLMCNFLHLFSHYLLDAFRGMATNGAGEFQIFSLIISLVG